MTRLLKQRSVANYLALTGQQMKPEDLVYTGLATHYVPSNRLEELESALAEATSAHEKNGNAKGKDAIASVLMSFHEFIPTDQCNLATNKKIIEQTFRAATVEEIVENLKEANTEFSISTLETLKQMSPTGTP